MSITCSLQIEMENLATNDKYSFVCNRWLADDEEDGSIVREIPAKGSGIKNPLPCKYIYLSNTCSSEIPFHDSTGKKCPPR